MIANPAVVTVDLSRRQSDEAIFSFNGFSLMMVIITMTGIGEYLPNDSLYSLNR